MAIISRARTLLLEEGRVTAILNALARDSFDETKAASLQGFVDDSFTNLSKELVWYVMNNSVSRLST